MYKFKTTILSILCIMVLTALTVSAMDAKFVSSINMTPSSPNVGDTVTFDIGFTVLNGSATSYKVVGGVDGVQLKQRVFATINQGETKYVNFTWVATAGPHTAYFTLDPDHTAGETDYTNNHETKLFTPGGGTSLYFDTASFQMTPPSPTTGQQTNFKIDFKVDKGPVTNLKVSFLVDGVVRSNGTYPSVNAGQTVSISFNWTTYIGTHTISFVLDPDHTTNDENFADNTFSHTFTPTLAGPSILWYEPSYSLNPASPQYGDKILFRTDFRVIYEPVDNLKIVGYIDNVQIKDKVYSHFEPGSTTGFAFEWEAFSPGTHTMKMEIDPAHTSGDRSFADNIIERTFTIPAPSAGSAPNLIITNVKVEKVQTTRGIIKGVTTINAGDNVKITFSVKNIGNLISPQVAVKIYRGANVIGNYPGIAATLAPGEKKTATFNTVVQCTHYKIVADPLNTVPESNETDNEWHSNLCKSTIEIGKDTGL
ncbi:MAG: hypothetical protein JW737_00715 [Acidobacteria bacterium]|nr:hypothetical protein [Acidobacteriota bacterium]